MKDFDDIDIELGRLGAATENIVPRPDFSDRVFQAVQAEAERDLFVSLKRAAPRLLPFAAFAAMIALAFAAESSLLLDDILTAYDAHGVDW